MKSNSPPLALALELFRSFETAAVPHCHFKSNEHLDGGLAGEADLDVLVDPAHGEAAELTLARLGFKRFPALHEASYPSPPTDDQLAMRRRMRVCRVASWPVGDLQGSR